MRPSETPPATSNELMTWLAPDSRRPRLMIADDDPVIQSVLGMSLSNRFELVGTAADSEEAVELARTTQPDAALVDVQMPKGGGLRAVLGILEVAPATAIVVLSIDESDETVRELIQAGAITYRRKDVGPEILADSLMQSIEAHTTARREAS